jgi:hypothetical protein
MRVPQWMVDLVAMWLLALIWLACGLLRSKHRGASPLRNRPNWLKPDLEWFSSWVDVTVKKSNVPDISQQHYATEGIAHARSPW